MPYGVDYGDAERRFAIAIAEAGGTGGGGIGGNVTVTNFPATQNVAGTVNVGNFPATQNIAVIQPAILRAAVNISSSGDNTIIAAVAGQKVKMLGGMLIANGDVNVTIKSGAGTNLSGAIPLAAKGNGFVIPISLAGYHLFETAVGAALVFNLSGAVAVTGAIAYLQEA